MSKEKPVKIHTDSTFNIKTGYCPGCNNYVLEIHNYCYNCGLKLDWENNELDKKQIL